MARKSAGSRAEELRKEGNVAYKAKQFEGAKELYSDALALLDPSDSKRATILVNRAMVHKQQNAHQDVINDTSAALDLDHANVKAYYHRAVAHEASDSLEKAISDYKLGLKIQPTNKALHRGLTRCSSIVAAAPTSSGGDKGRPESGPPPAETLAPPPPSPLAAGSGDPPLHPAVAAAQATRPEQPSPHSAPVAPSPPGNLPSLALQRATMGTLLKQGDEIGRREGDVWFLLDRRWWDRWCAYTGFGAAGEGDEGATDPAKAPPGPIDNRPLLAERGGGTGKDTTAAPPPTGGAEIPRLPLRGGVREGDHFVLLPDQAWRAVHDWFGGGPALARPVERTNGETPSVQLYTDAEREDAAKAEDAANERARRARLAARGDTSEVEEEEEEEEQNETVRASEDRASTTCVACWQPARTRCKQCRVAWYCCRDCQVSHWRHHKRGCAATQGDASAVPRSMLLGRRGVVGMANLGNTCFMNSALQCLAHTVPVVRAFLSNEFRDEINKDNVLGTQGVFATAIGNLFRELWFGGERSLRGPPRAFFGVLRHVAPQFADFAQHDAQEFLTLALDKIHEDLNRVQRKPYVEMPEGDGRSDTAVADEAWDKHLSRNQSVIVDATHGQFKSTVVCPDCERRSVTFDPFSCVTLEVPSRRDITFHVILCRHRDVADVSVDSAGAPPPTRFAVRLPLTQRVNNLAEAVARMGGVEEDDLLLAEKTRKGLRGLRPLDKLRTLEEGAIVYAFESKGDGYFFHVKQTTDMGAGAVKFGQPFPITIPRSGSINCLRAMVWDRVKRYASPPEAVLEAAEQQAKELAEREGLENATSLERLREQVTYIAILSSLDLSVVHCGRKMAVPDRGEDAAASVLGVKGGAVTLEWDADWAAGLDRKGALACEKDASVAKAIQEAKEQREAGDSITLGDCFRKFTASERLDPSNMWYCRECKEHKQAEKTMQFWRLPDTLVLHLKRFEYSNVGIRGFSMLSRDKITRMVRFPLEGLDLSQYLLHHEPEELAPVYDLYAVANHYGGMGGGHYTAFAHASHTDEQSAHANQWHEFDDSHCDPVAPERVCTPAAYILFYRRRGAPAKPPRVLPTGQ